MLETTLVPGGSSPAEYQIFFSLPPNRRFVWDGRTRGPSDKRLSNGLIREQPEGREVFLTPESPTDVTVWVRTNLMKGETVRILFDVPEGITMERPAKDGGPAVEYKGKKTMDLPLAEGIPLTRLAFRCLCSDIFRRGTLPMRLSVLKDSRVISSEVVYVTRPFDWVLSGPFPATTIDDPKPDIGKLDKTSPWKEPIGKREWTWHAPREWLGPGGRVDLNRAFGRTSNSTAFACTRISAPADGEYEFLMASDDRIIVWVNGTEFYRDRSGGAAGWSRRLRKVSLRKGPNTILVKTFQKQRHWEFKVAPILPPGVTGIPFTEWDQALKQ
jgi:hypothetical protein